MKTNLYSTICRPPEGSARGPQHPPLLRHCKSYNIVILKIHSRSLSHFFNWHCFASLGSRTMSTHSCISRLWCLLSTYTTEISEWKGHVKKDNKRCSQNRNLKKKTMQAKRYNACLWSNACVGLPCVFYGQFYTSLIPELSWPITPRTKAALSQMM